MANRFYGKGIKHIMNKDIDLDADTIKVALLTSSYTPNIDTDEFFSDLTGEVSGTGYTAGGKDLTGLALTLDAANSRVYLAAGDPSWAGSTITNARYAAVYQDTGSAATSKLIGLIDFGGNKSTTGDTFYIQLATNANGSLLYISY